MKRYVTFFITLCMVATMQLHSSDQQQKQPAKPLTLGQSIVVGGVVGAAEVAFPGQPLSYAMNVAIKNAQLPQVQRERFVFSHSYKGFAANALGQMPITAMQKAVQSKGTQWAEKEKGSALSDWQKAGVSYAAGVAGAVIDTPSNAVQLYLQDKANAGQNTAQALRTLGGKSFRGFAPNAFLKEGPFVVGYQMLAQKGAQVAQKYVGDNLAAVALGGAAAGVVTAVATHPGAVMRNKMQNDPDKKTYTSSWQTAKKVCVDEGVKGLFNGLKERGTRVAIAVPLYVAYTTLLEAQMKK